MLPACVFHDSAVTQAKPGSRMRLSKKLVYSFSRLISVMNPLNVKLNCCWL